MVNFMCCVFSKEAPLLQAWVLPLNPIQYLMLKKKRAARKKTPRKKSTRRKSSRRKSGISKLRILKYLLLASLVIGTIYTIYLDFTIRNRFEGNRWEIPARVYARSLELYEGLHINPADLKYELAKMRYRKTDYPKAPGSYSVHNNEYIIVTRPFHFWDGEEPSQRLRMTLDNQVVTKLEHATTREALSIVRLDPVYIASIYPRHNEDRILVQLKDVPPLISRTLIEVEDRNFTKHHGIDYMAIGRALYANIRAGRAVQGGSTITQQLVKNYFLTNKRSLTRKINEAMMATLLEFHYDKNDILESYLNEVYLGQDGQRSINGFGLASQFYFGRRLKNLKPHHAALLVGLVKGPSYYDPRKHPKRAKKRRNLVLDILAERGVISGELRNEYQSQPLGVIKARGNSAAAYPAFIDLVKRQLRRDYNDDDLSSAGLRIFTTLNPVVQNKAEKALTNKLNALEKGYNLPSDRLQGAVIVSNVSNGEVQAIVGDRKPRFSGFNRALDAIRSIGSLIKPAVYLSALNRDDYSLATLIDDEALQVEQREGVWEPQNYDHEYHGQVPLFLGLVNSYNIATVRLGMQVGLSTVVNMIKDLGVNRPINAFPSTLLGTISMSPLEVAQMYQTLAGAGFHTPLRSIRAVMDAHDKPLNRYPLSVTQVLKPEDALLINHALHLVTRMGTAKQLKTLLPEGMHVAGKTGTTDNLRDSWFAGFSRDYLSVVWMGHDDDKPTRFTGASGAMQVWAKLMSSIQAQALDFAANDNIEYAWIDIETGKRTDEGCGHGVELPFKTGTVPEEEVGCSGGLSGWFERILGD